jgi:hypothetical protein
VTQNRFFGLQTFEPIPDEWAATIAAKGWGRVRVEGVRYDDVMAQCQKHTLWPLWILRRGQEATVPSGIDVEIGNECNAGCAPDWPKLTPAEYAAWVSAAAPSLLGRGNTVYVGAANNTSPAGIAWTRDVLALLPMHPRLRVSFHRYPDPDQDVSKPKKGYKTLADEDRAILDCVKGRRWALSEAGLVDATTRDWSSWKYFGKKHTRLAVDGHRWQAARFKRLGADFYVVYQMQGEYGIRRPDGTWKQAADLPRG